MKKRIGYTLLFSVLALNLCLGAFMYSSSAQAAEENDPYAYYELFANVLEKVRKRHVDGDKFTYKDLFYGALKGMLNTLDPHSEFMEPREYEDLKDDTQGEFGGIGIQIGIREGVITVVAPMEDTPAFRAGVLAGDQIVSIGGRSTEKFTESDAAKLLRGVPGTEVSITTVRPSNGETREIQLKRAIIHVSSIKDINNEGAFPLDDNKIGYVRINQFVEPTSDELDKALKKLTDQGMQGLVLDLRGNPGGLLDQAVKVSEKFLERNQLIVTTEGQTRDMNTSHYSRSRGLFRDLPMVILVNHGSASASEIVAGCLQDLKRAYVIGEQTFGKGSVQSIDDLPGGAALRLTTARYYTPSHKVIHERGITPDGVVEMTPEERLALIWRRLPGGIESVPADKRDLVRNSTDKQLERAIDLLRGLRQAKMLNKGTDTAGPVAPVAPKS